MSFAKNQKIYDEPDQRIFTIPDIQKLIRSQKKKILKASYIGAIVGCFTVLILFSPRYQIRASFKEAPSTNSSGMGGIGKFIGGFGASNGDSQVIALMQSYQVLKPLIERLGIQAVVSKKGLLSKVYRRVRDNILAEGRQELSDIDWFMFQDVLYDGRATLSYSLQFTDQEHFFILSGDKTLASGTIGAPVYLPEAKLTIVKVPKLLKIGTHYPLSIQPWTRAAQAIRSHFQIVATKNNPSIYELSYSHRDRYFGAKLLNGLMEEYRNYLQRDHDQVVRDQLSYLQDRQEEICRNMGFVLDEYTKYIEHNFSQSGQVSVEQSIKDAAKEYNFFSNRVFAIDLELDRLSRMGKDQKTVILSDEKAFAGVLRTSLETISALKQQRDLIELSLSSNSDGLNDLEYENRKQGLQEVRNQLSSMQGLLDEINKGSLLPDSLFNIDASLQAWASRLTNSQEKEREDLAEYVEHHVHLLAMQEKGIQEGIYYDQEIPTEFQGIDLATARNLFVQYNSKLDQSLEAMKKCARLCEEILQDDFEISSLSAVFDDPLSQSLVKQASEIAFKLRDEKYHSVKEGERWKEDLSLQKKILQDHLNQLCKVEEMKLDIIHDKIASLQRISLRCISGQISVLQEKLSDSIKEQACSLALEKKLLEEKMQQVLQKFTDIPEKWRQEKWLNLKTQMSIKMVEALTELVESKTVSSHLHHVESKPLDIAVIPSTPCVPGLLVKACLGAFFAGFAVLIQTFFRTLLKGFPTSIEKLRAMRYPVLGEISHFCDGVHAEPLGGTDLETLRQMALFLESSPKGKIIGIIEGIGPDYSYAMAEHFSRMSFRSLVVRCDFNVKFSLHDMPGLLQVWNKEITDLPIRSRHGYDYITSGGYTPYGAEIVRSQVFRGLLEDFRKKYDFVFLIFRSPLHSVESFAPLACCDKAVVTVCKDPTEQLTPFIDWAYHDGTCRLAFLTLGPT